MGMEFELTIKITGTSLDEIDQGLTTAAGARIAARMQKPVAQPTFTQPKPQKAVQVPKTTAESKGRGRPPLKEGEVGKYVKRASDSDAIEPEPSNVRSYTLDDAQNAILRVNETLDMPAAMSCLNFFGVEKCQHLDPSQFEEFIKYCERKIEDGI